VEFGEQLRSNCHRSSPSEPWECECWNEHRTFLDALDVTTACQVNLQRCLEIRGGDMRQW
jgi:hypothetical protein